MNYARLINRVSAARKPSPIRVLTALLAKSPPSMISLAGGAPNPDLFPFESVEIKLRDGSLLSLNEQKMKTALQYGPTQGHGEFLSWLKFLQKSLHNPPTVDLPPDHGGMDVLVTPGSQDAICKTMEMMIDPGDNVVVDSPTYSGTLAILRPMDCNLLGVETDKHGMIPNSLRAIMSKWQPSESSNPDCKIPRILYTIPNGVNPTGACLTLQRKKEIYQNDTLNMFVTYKPSIFCQIARDYNMVIIEDDPYYYLQFADRVPSYLSMDQDGRVLRFDSFSKILSSGMRVGFVTGPQPLIYSLQLHMMVSVMHTPMLSQYVYRYDCVKVFMNEQLQMWGIDGFLNHVQSVVDFYRSQKDCMLEAAEKYLTGLAEWDEPQAGMFFWFKLKGIPDSKALIEEKALAKEVMLVPGCAFMPDDSTPCPFVRASYSLASHENIHKGIARFAELIKEEMALK